MGGVRMSQYLQNNMLLPIRNLEQNNWWSFILAPFPLNLHSLENFVFFANKNGRVVNVKVTLKLHLPT